MSVQTIEQRVGELLRLRDKIDAELARIDGCYRPGRRRSRHEIPPCGTETAYQRHKYFDEACPEGDACRLAHNAHEKTANMLRRMRKVAA